MPFRGCTIKPTPWWDASGVPDKKISYPSFWKEWVLVALVSWMAKTSMPLRCIYWKIWSYLVMSYNPSTFHVLNFRVAVGRGFRTVDFGACTCVRNHSVLEPLYGEVWSFLLLRYCAECVGRNGGGDWHNCPAQTACPPNWLFHLR